MASASSVLGLSQPISATVTRYSRSSNKRAAAKPSPPLLPGAADKDNMLAGFKRLTDAIGDYKAGAAHEFGGGKLRLIAVFERSKFVKIKDLLSHGELCKLGVEKRCAIVRRRLLNRFLPSFPEASARRANRQNRRDYVSRRRGVLCLKI